MEEDPETEDLKQENYKINQTCDICNKQITTNSDITRHKQTHDFNHFCDKCENCKFGAHTTYDLKRHENSHHLNDENTKNIGKHVKHQHGLAKELDSCDIATKNKKIFYLHVNDDPADSKEVSST